MKPEKKATQLLNLFRQIHVLEGGIKKFNEELLKANQDEIDLLPALVGGVKLFRHYKTLKNKQIKIDQIARENLPFQELEPKGVIDAKIEEIPTAVQEKTKPANVSSLSNSVLKDLDSFAPDTAHLTNFKKDLGENWKKRLAKFVEITTLTEKQFKAYRQVLDFADAIDAWNIAENILEEDNQIKAKSQLPILEKKLSKFGNAGKSLLKNLQDLIKIS
ncbi:MAG: hypothetical protein ACTSXL_03725 [Alphaproteobacteria bacterium]